MKSEEDDDEASASIERQTSEETVQLTKIMGLINKAGISKRQSVSVIKSGKGVVKEIYGEKESNGVRFIIHYYLNKAHLYMFSNVFQSFCFFVEP